jgi:hypothetical protein
MVGQGTAGAVATGVRCTREPDQQGRVRQLQTDCGTGVDVSGTQRTMEFFRNNPHRWIEATRFEPIGGRQAWRTRLSEARVKFEADGEGTIENRQRRMKVDGREWTLSEYMFVPAPELPTRVEPSGQVAFI